MPPKKTTTKAAKDRPKLERNRVGDLFADVPDETGEGKVRVSFRRNWYSPPLTDDGEVDFERAAEELEHELAEGTLVVRRHLDNGDLGFATEIPVASKKELENILQVMRKVFVEGLQHDNAIRQAALETCKTTTARLEHQAQLAEERRQDTERRLLRRRGRRLLGLAWFRNDDRRAEADRRIGMERRAAEGRVARASQ
jgi:hypothetical protein